jgi:hypothetical protein
LGRQVVLDAIDRSASRLGKALRLAPSLTQRLLSLLDEFFTAVPRVGTAIDGVI